MEAYTNDTASPASASRIEGTDAAGMAWLNYTRSLGSKQLVPIPWMVAMALQQDGWILRCDIIWAKPNPMPESVTDRPTKAHEYLFLLSKSERTEEYRAQGLNTRFNGAVPGSPTSPTITTTGWKPTCAHDDGSGASLVLDIFNGSGTTGAVAVRHGRSYVGLDISREYLVEQAVYRVDPLSGAALDARTAIESGQGQAQTVMQL